MQKDIVSLKSNVENISPKITFNYYEYLYTNRNIMLLLKSWKGWQ